MTPESIQAMIDQALLRNSTNGDGSHSSHGDNRRNVQTARPCFYADFMKCQPLNFKGTEGVVGLTRWIEKMESVFNISGCAIENQVKFATCTLLGDALTWWNGQIRTLDPEAYAMTWEVLKKKITDKYCPQGEIKKLEIELWNLKVKGNDVPAYTERFQELTLICTKFVANETEKVDKKFATYVERPIMTTKEGLMISSKTTYGSPTATLQKEECRKALQHGDRQGRWVANPGESLFLSVELRDTSERLSQTEDKNISWEVHGMNKDGFMTLGLQKRGEMPQET
ncbi:reverse transcriptase domain-containing protein [Tanacetum coccineum]